MSDAHLSARPLDPKGEVPRRWQCIECHVVGATYVDLCLTDCTAAAGDPCLWCGQVGICAADCMGIAVALIGIDVWDRR